MDSAVRATVPLNFCPGNSCSVTQASIPFLMAGARSLRDADVHAQRIDAGHIEQFLAGAAGVDQRAGIDVAFGQHSAEGRVHVFERLQFFQTANVGVICVQVGLGLLIAAGLLIGFLLRNRQSAAERRRQLAAETGELAGELMTTLVGAGWSQQDARDANIRSLIWPEVDQ